MAMLPDYKEIVELVKKGMDLEAQAKILDWRAEAIRLKEENLGLKDRIKKLEDKLSIEENLDYVAPYYWLKTEEGKDGPFCQHCRDKHNKLIRLQERKKGVWVCEACQKVFTDKDYTPEKIQQPKRTRSKIDRW